MESILSQVAHYSGTLIEAMALVIIVVGSIEAFFAGIHAMEATNLAVFWASVIALSILIYVILDGFDLGVGVLFGFTRDETNRFQMLNTIAPFWDGNETWRRSWPSSTE